MVKLSIISLVSIALSVIILIFGIFFLLKISSLKEIVPEYPATNQMMVSVEPANSQKGTLFLIQAAYTAKREAQDLSLIIEKQGQIYPIQLYDDGNHFDKKPRDGVYSGFFDSTNVSLGKYNIKNQDDTLAFFEVSESGCESVYGNGDVKIMVLHSGYDDYNEFKADLKSIITSPDSLLQVEPFSSSKNSFSFLSAINSRDLSCEIGCKNISTIVCCDNKLVYEEASKCEFDSILVLVNSNKRCGSASSYAKICAKNPDANLILIHEFGHSFANLADEYVYSDYFGDYSVGEVNEVNCAQKDCEKWKEITEGCFEGCTYSNLYRPTKKNSVMYDLYPQFNEVCQYYIKQLIQNYETSKKDTEKSMPKSYFVNLHYNEGNTEIKNIYLKPVYSSEDYRKSDYSALIKDSVGNRIFGSGIYIPNKLYPIPPNGTIVYEKEFDFSIVLPYYPAGDELVIYRKETPVASASLSVFADSCGNNICDAFENRISCSEDCTINDNFCETALCDPDCASQKNCEKEMKMKYILPLILISVAAITMLLVLIGALRKNKN
jgi:hypothetical protein